MKLSDMFLRRRGSTTHSFARRGGGGWTGEAINLLYSLFGESIGAIHGDEGMVESRFSNWMKTSRPELWNQLVEHSGPYHSPEDLEGIALGGFTYGFPERQNPWPFDQMNQIAADFLNENPDITDRIAQRIKERKEHYGYWRGIGHDCDRLLRMIGYPPRTSPSQSPLPPVDAPYGPHTQQPTRM